MKKRRFNTQKKEKCVTINSDYQRLKVHNCPIRREFQMHIKSIWDIDKFPNNRIIDSQLIIWKGKESNQM